MGDQSLMTNGFLCYKYFNVIDEEKEEEECKT